MVPIAGPFLAELAGTVIPRQRADRLADFARALADDMQKLRAEVLQSKLEDEHFTDLLEEGTREALSAVSPERRHYIASLISNGLTEDRVTYVESKHLLRLLSQLNDIEIIWLRFYDYPMLAGDEEFRERHAAILRPVQATLASGPDEIDKQALQQNYVEHLVSLGLLARPLFVDPKTRQPIYDPMARSWKTEGRRTTPLGKLLLRQIGHSAPETAA
ncbi:MAG: hypothetical protein CVU30_18220 [Betaproteobacteria bacterium HGW-Betaproteobacteria-3]|nr:MAG: hypothetical protein CVU30_18220 [Betaproteobacteria bacterium HGW-Betaproteobacteria-3]